MQNLVSIILLTYNQENFITEAVDSLLAQTYSPLEIVISDDESSDGTWEKIISITDKYQGPHKIILNRNQQNMGINAHINKACALATGRFIIAAAGDDISMPERATLLTEVLLSGVAGVFSDAIIFNSDNPTETRLIAPPGYLGMNDWKTMAFFGSHGSWGCATAWDKRVFDIFGDIPLSPIGEDAFVPFRCALAGGFSFLSQPLVKYRDHGGNISFWSSYKNGTNQERIKLGCSVMDFEVEMHRTWLSDINVACEAGLISTEDLFWAEEMLEHHDQVARRIIELLSSSLVLLFPMFLVYSFLLLSFRKGRRGRVYLSIKKMLRIIIQYRFPRIFKTISSLRGRN